MADPLGSLEPFPNLRVLEVGRGVGVASAGLALTALGADVVQVGLEPRLVPAVERAYYDRGRTVVAGSEPLTALTASADVILCDADDDEMRALGVPTDRTELRAGPSPQVLVTVRSLGRTGPNSWFRMTDLTEWASSGLAQVTRRPQPPESDLYVPVLPPGHQPQALSGLAAATAVVVGWRWACAQQRPVVADVSVQEVVAAMLHGIFPSFVWDGVVTGHPSTAATALGMMLPAADGDVYIRTLDPRQWEALMSWIDDPTLEAIGGDPDSRLANNDVLKLLMGQWAAKYDRHWLLEEGQRRRVPIALPRSVEDVLAWQHLRARGVWRDIDLEGTAAEAPRLPLLEPPGWRRTTKESAGTVASRWAS